MYYLVTPGHSRKSFFGEMKKFRRNKKYINIKKYFSLILMFSNIALCLHQLIISGDS